MNEEYPCFRVLYTFLNLIIDFILSHFIIDSPLMSWLGFDHFQSSKGSHFWLGTLAMLSGNDLGNSLVKPQLLPPAC